MNLFDEFFAISGELQRHGIEYALVGGIALSFHSIVRSTKDIDFLVLPGDAEAIKDLLVPLGYFESAEPWTFSSTNITLRRFMKTEGERYLYVDLMIGNEPKHREIIEQALAADYQGTAVRVARKEDLIWLKRHRNSLQDQADIENLS